MLDGSDTLEAKVLLKCASNIFDMWAEYLGSTILSRAAYATGTRLNSADGGTGSVSVVNESMFSAHQGEQQKLWNLLTAYEPSSGHILRGNDMRFVNDGPRGLIETSRALQLRQYRS